MPAAVSEASLARCKSARSSFIAAARRFLKHGGQVAAAEPAGGRVKSGEKAKDKGDRGKGKARRRPCAEVKKCASF